MTLKEITSYLQISNSKLFELVKSGKIKRVQKNLYDTESIMKYKSEKDFRIKNKAKWI